MKVQHGLQELQVQTSVLQVSVVQASMDQASLKQARMTTLQVELSIDLHAMQLSKGLLYVDTPKDRVCLLHMKNLSLNLVVLPIQTLHELH